MLWSKIIKSILKSNCADAFNRQKEQFESNSFVGDKKDSPLIWPKILKVVQKCFKIYFRLKHVSSLTCPALNQHPTLFSRFFQKIEIIAHRNDKSRAVIRKRSNAVIRKVESCFWYESIIDFVIFSKFCFTALFR